MWRAEDQHPADVAVIVPTILRPSLERAVRSVFGQDLSATIQILIGIDKPAGDGDLLRRLKATAPGNVRITILDLGYSTSQRHGGLVNVWGGGALRTMLSYAANSRYLAYLDDDNWWDEKHLSSLLEAVQCAEWAYSKRWFVDAQSLEPLCVDEWESLGPGQGVFKDSFGGFVDPNCLLLDSFACEPVLRLWSVAPEKKAGRMADRNIFHNLKNHFSHSGTGLPTAFYVLQPADPRHPERLEFIRGAEPGPAEFLAREAARRRDEVAGWPERRGAKAVASAAAPLIFIGGAARSGTTLLQSILCADEDANPLIREAQWITHFTRLYRWSKDNFAAIQQDYFATPEEYRDFHAKLLTQFLVQASRRLGERPCLVLKNPEMTALFGDLRELATEARFTVMMRDPRDIIASMLEVQAKFDRQKKTAPIPLKRDMKTLSQRVRSYYAPFADPGLRENTLFVRYEDLTCEPRHEVQRLRDFTGLALADFDPARDWSQAGGGDAYQPGRYKEYTTELFGEAISRRRIGKFRTRLNPDEIATVEHECADIFKSFGYRPQHDPQAP